MMRYHLCRGVAIFVSVLMAAFLPISSTYGKHQKSTEPPFAYVAGTESVEKGCAGKLEVLKDELTFRCPGAAITLPFSQITVMQYRPNVSAEVLAMKIPWNLKPLFPRVKENQYFTVVCNDQGKLRAIVLRAGEDTMRPYFAEIELESGKSVQEYRSFDEF